MVFNLIEFPKNLLNDECEAGLSSSCSAGEEEWRHVNRVRGKEVNGGKGEADRGRILK